MKTSQTSILEDIFFAFIVSNKLPVIHMILLIVPPILMQSNFNKSLIKPDAL